MNLAWIRTSGVGIPLAGKRGRFGARRLAGGALGAFETPRNLGLAEGLKPSTPVSRSKPSAGISCRATDRSPSLAEPHQLPRSEVDGGALPTEGADGHQPGVNYWSLCGGARSLGRVAGARPACHLIRHIEGLLALRRRASPPSPYRTTAIGRGENVRLRRRGASRMFVSAWDTRRCSAKTPRNRGDFSGCTRVRAGSLCSSGLVGGAGGPARTGLSAPIP